MRWLLAVLTLCVVSMAQAQAAKPEESVVKVLASIRYPNPIRPWTNGQPGEVVGTGVIIDGKRILTNAHLTLYATEVQIQYRPGDEKIPAKVQSLASDMDLALLTIEDDQFFQKHAPLPRSAKLPKVQDNVAVYGFPIGGNDLSVTKGVVSRIDHGPYFSNGYGQIIQISAAVNPGNSGGPAVVNDEMIGVVFSRLNEGEGVGYVIPNEEITTFLTDIGDGKYDGKPVDATGTDFHMLENAGLRAFLKLDKKTKGVMATLPPRRPADYQLKEFDVVTKIAGHEVDNQGLIQTADGLRAPLDSILAKEARNGSVLLTVLRDGKTLEVPLPVTTADQRLIRDLRGEKPSYFIHGPLVFATAKAEAIQFYARLNPGLFNGRSPLLQRRFDRVAFPDEELVVVTSPMFKHKITEGYGDAVGQVVAEVNGVKIKNLRHLVELLRDVKDEFLIFRFAESSTSILVFNRAEMNKATDEILDDNGISPNRRGSEDMLKVWRKEG
jgi:S1-C subfamily serine protease